MSVKARQDIYDRLDPEGRRLVEEALRRLGATGGDDVGVDDLLGGAGAALGGYADASAANRGSQIEAEAIAEQINQQAERDYFNMALARERDRREGGSDAWKKLRQAEHRLNAKDYKPANGLPSYGIGPRAATPTERIAAEEVAREAIKRLRAGDSQLPPVVDRGRFQIDPKLLKGSAAERLAGAGSVAATVASRIPRSTWSKVGKGLGKVFGKLF